MEEKAKKAKSTIEMLQSQMVDTSDQVKNYEQFFEVVKAHTHIDELTAEIVNAFIDRIEIGERSVKRAKKKPSSQNIRIFYKFIGDVYVEEGVAREV